MDFKKGDFVSRKSYNSDIIFRIESIEGEKAILRSYLVRLMADAPLNDLIKVDSNNIKKLKHKLFLESFDYIQRQQRHLILSSKQMRSNTDLNNAYKDYPVKVLHLDGDQDYLDLSLANYKNLNINARGYYIPERGQPEEIYNFVKEYRPDILVITGHDGELDDSEYHTSDFFVKTVEIARSVEPDLDNLVIFAGACQSDYERLIASGANYASSPENKLIHFLDPILVVEKVAFTPIREVISVKEVVQNTVTGEGGIGGIETRGKLRLRYP